ncbi:NAD(P)H-binding protein [Flavobacterium collinsii]|uniref:NAD(P)-bd_dom domain-containing protein n=1 Tax=Flavobacterium collinsii TaxID=1114861 RepID=A0A9W4X2J0_9FLAO|nr:NAD(P)H-binding protein [Flavobacterium collinsii]CAI2766317.1 NAD(P)-bd_dom domain-containing protein [Flavobacterium collinsii]
MKKAILYGASGLVGSYILENLLNNDNYEQVIIVVRKDLNIQHPKLKTLIGDFNSLPKVVKDIQVDEVFIALGTTQKKTPDKKLYYQIDHDYPILAAKLAKENGAKAVFLVSALGANAKSSIFYTKLKGETEQGIITLDLQHTYIFRPSIILGDRKESRPMEKVFIGIFKLINPLFVGSLSKYKGIEAEDIAKAMVKSADQLDQKVKIVHWEEMTALLK